MSINKEKGDNEQIKLELKLINNYSEILDLSQSYNEGMETKYAILLIRTPELQSTGQRDHAKHIFRKSRLPRVALIYNLHIWGKRLLLHHNFQHGGLPNLLQTRQRKRHKQPYRLWLPGISRCWLATSNPKWATKISFITKAIRLQLLPDTCQTLGNKFNSEV